MFAKVVIFCAAVAAAHASLVGPLGYGGLGYGAPLAAVGPLGIGKGLIAGPAAVATQSAVINHVAPVGYAAAPLAIAGNGLLANGLVAGHGLAGPLAYGNGLLGAGAYGNGLLGAGVYGNGLLGAGAYGLGLGAGKLGLGAPGVVGLGLGKVIL